MKTFIIKFAVISAILFNTGYTMDEKSNNSNFNNFDKAISQCKDQIVTYNKLLDSQMQQLSALMPHFTCDYIKNFIEDFCIYSLCNPYNSELSSYFKVENNNKKFGDICFNISNGNVL